jgi:hypothetical protein
MFDGTRASLLLFSLLSALGLAPLVLRGLKPTPLLVLHSVGLFVAFAAAMASESTHVGTSALGLPYLVMLSLVVVDRRGQRSPVALRIASGVVVAFGLLATVALRMWPSLSPVVTILSALTAVAFTTTTMLILRGLSSSASSGARAASWQTVAMLVAAAMSLVLPVLVLVGAGTVAHAFWPLTLGAAGGVVSSARAPPHVQPTPRELVVACFLGIAAFFVVMTFAGPAAGALAGALFMLFDVGIVALSRPLLESAGPWPKRPVKQKPAHVPLIVDLVSREALSALTPLLDHDAVLRPRGGSVVVRITAQSLLDAALEHARQRSESPHLDKSRVTLVVEDAEADVECDPSELSAVLGDILQVARTRSSDDTAAMRVRLRAGPREITYEFSSEGPTENGGTPNAPYDLEHPFTLVDGGFPGLALSRARVVIEKHGGLLIYRPTERGHFVQVTIPRRQHRPRAARA